jgi:hypothetical protein
VDSSVISLPFLLPHRDDLIAILPRKFWVDAVVRYGKVFSPANSPFSLFTPGDQRLSQWGLGRGTQGSAFLSPTKEAKKIVTKKFRGIFNQISKFFGVIRKSFSKG